VAEEKNELVITRTFDAPRELVFKAWTEPERIKQWLAPRGFKIPVAEGELRPGGKWRQSMVAPDGMQLWLGGVYKEINPPERLVFTHAWDDPTGKPGPETTCTVVFTERNGKTEMNFRQGPFPAADSKSQHNDGWSQCFDRLSELLANTTALTHG